MARPLFAQVNIAALRANLAQVRVRAPKTQVLAVVKANAYGHGLLRVLPALADADGLAIAELDAALELRAAHQWKADLCFIQPDETRQFTERQWGVS